MLHPTLQCPLHTIQSWFSSHVFLIRIWALQELMFLRDAPEKHIFIQSDQGGCFLITKYPMLLQGMEKNWLHQEPQRPLKNTPESKAPSNPRRAQNTHYRYPILTRGVQLVHRYWKVWYHDTFQLNYQKRLVQAGGWSSVACVTYL